MTNDSRIDRRTFLQQCATAATLAGSAVWSLDAASAPRPSHYVHFGKTDLKISRFCQGTAFRVNKRDPEDDMAQRVLHHCIDVGINFFDSSNAYGWGGSELALGKAIRGKRSRLVICTKVHPGLKPQGDEPSQRVPFTREFAFREAEGSLKRLGTDYVDLYLLHNPDGITPPEEVTETMEALVRDGKTRYWGVSNHKPEQVRKFSELGASGHASHFAGIQNEYNIVNRELEREMFPLLRQTGIGLMPYGPLDAGHLLKPVPPGDTAKATLLAEVDKVGRSVNASRVQTLLAWVLSHPEATCVLGAAEKPEHVDENFAATGIVLPPDAVARLNSASDAWLAAQSPKS